MASAVGKDESTRPFKCEQCGSRYTRQEHLDRHVTAKHSGLKEFVCPTCGKCFARRDILKRHELGHVKQGIKTGAIKAGSEDDDYVFSPSSSSRSSKKHDLDVTYDGSVKVKTPRVAKACTRCSKSKLRCDGVEPCSRCEKAGVECAFSSRPMSRKMSNDDTPDYEEEDDELGDRFRNPFPYDSHPSTSRNPYELPVSVPAAPQPPFGTIAPPYGPSPQVSLMFSSSSHLPPPAMLPPLQSIFPGHQDTVNSAIDTRLDAFSPPTSFPSPASRFNYRPSMTFSSAPLTAPWATDGRPTSSQGTSSSQIRNSSDFFDLLTSHIDQESEIDWSVLNAMPTPQGAGDVASPGRAADGGDDHQHGRARFEHDARAELGSVASSSMLTSDATPTMASASPSSANITDTAAASLLKLAAHTPGQSPEPERARNSHRSHAPADPWPLSYRPTQPSENITGGGRSRAVSPDQHDLGRIQFALPLVPRLTSRTRESIMAHVQDISRDYAPFAGSDRWVPPVEILDLFVQLYFDKYHAYLPIIHVPTFDPNTSPPYLTLAIASTGARYAHDRITGSSTYAFALLELARRMNQVMGDLDNRLLQTVQWHQAGIISLLAGLSSGNKRDLERSQAFRAIALTFCRRQGWLRDIEVDEHEEENRYTLEERWKRWRDREEIKRLGFATIILDGLSSSMWDMESMSVYLDAVHSSLPCHDSLWEANAAMTWASLSRGSVLPSKPIGLLEAISLICTPGDPTSLDKLGPSSRDQFAMLVVIMVMVVIGINQHRTTLTTTLFLPQASQWGETFSTSPVFLALNAGLEWYADRVLLPPEIQAILPDATEPSNGNPANILTLMLHFTSMTLRLPLRILQPLARTGIAPLAKCVADAIKTWASDEDGRVARRTAFHAGQLIALTRQGSGEGPLESIALFYAALALLLFIQEQVQPGQHDHQQQQQQQQQQQHGGHERIDLDRFVDRHEDAMDRWINMGQGVPSLTNIGLLNDPLAAEKMLRVTIAKLSKCKTWRISELLSRQLEMKVAEEEQTRKTRAAAT